MTARTLTAAEQRVREHVLAIAMGYCCLCSKQATNFGHRLPEGQGGPFIVPNGLPVCGSGTTGCHGLSESRRALSYSCGWLIRDAGPVEGRAARIADVPALVRTQLGPGWHILDSIEDGKPIGMPRLAGPGEVPGWMFGGTYEDAVGLLHRGRAA